MPSRKEQTERLMITLNMWLVYHRIQQLRLFSNAVIKSFGMNMRIVSGGCIMCIIICSANQKNSCRILKLPVQLFILMRLALTCMQSEFLYGVGQKKGFGKRCQREMCLHRKLYQIFCRVNCERKWVIVLNLILEKNWQKREKVGIMICPQLNTK